MQLRYCDSERQVLKPTFNVTCYLHGVDIYMHMVEFSEGGVTFLRLAFEDHCELCDAVQRRHGNAGQAVHMSYSLRDHAQFETPLVGSVGRLTLR